MEYCEERKRGIAKSDEREHKKGKEGGGEEHIIMPEDGEKDNIGIEEGISGGRGGSTESDGGTNRTDEEGSSDQESRVYERMKGRIREEASGN